MGKRKIIYLTPLVFLLVVLTLSDLKAQGFNNLQSVINESNEGLNVNILTNKFLGPVNPYCGKIDVTSYISSKILISPNQKITGIKRLEDSMYRYFAITVIDFSSSKTNIWLFDIGQDGVFSNDDSARKIINLSGIHYNAIEVVRITRSISNGGEELFWIERNSSSSTSSVINSCELPNCTYINNIANLPVIMGYSLSTYSNFNLLPVDYGIYLVSHNNINNMKEISYCSLIRNDLNWCGNPASLYSTIYSTNTINKISGVKNEGIAFSDLSSKKFFNINTWRINTISSGSMIETIKWSGLSGTGNYAFMAEEQNGQTNLVALDTVSGTSLFIDLIDNSTGLSQLSSPLFLDPRLNYFIAVFNKASGGTYKKTSFGSTPIKIFDDLNYWDEGDLIITKDKKLYSFSRSDLKLYSYECN